MNKPATVSLFACLSLFGLAPKAQANDVDKAACEGLGIDDPCVRKDGDAGTCQPDESDPETLTCEDEIDGDGDADGTTGAMDTDDSPGSDNEIACDGLDLGDACVRDDGDAGTCVPDESDPDVLECEDDHTGGGDSTGDDSDDSGSNNDESDSNGDESDSNGDDSNGDTLACEALEEGDACTRSDGDAGTCIPDESDPGVLECEDHLSAQGGSMSNDEQAEDPMDLSFSCSISEQGPSAPAALSLLLLLGLGRSRSRRRRA